MKEEILVMAFIFFARIADVSLGTIRIILISKGYRYVAPLFGFVEIMIWLAAISTALEHLTSIYSYIIYAGGFAMGNYVGMFLEAKLPIGNKAFRVVTARGASALPLALREEGFGVTSVEGRGMKGPVSIIYSLVHKKEVKRFMDVVSILEPEAFITIEDVRSYKRGFFTRKTFPGLLGRGMAKKK